MICVYGLPRLPLVRTRRGVTECLQMTLLPRPLIKLINENFSSQDRDKVMKVASRIYYDTNGNSCDANTFKAYPANFKKAILGSHTKLWTKMTVKGIFEVENGGSYSTTKRKCKKYRINPMLLDGELLPVEYYLPISNAPVVIRNVHQSLKNLALNIPENQSPSEFINHNLWRIEEIVEKRLRKTKKGVIQYYTKGKFQNIKDLIDLNLVFEDPYLFFKKDKVDKLKKQYINSLEKLLLKVPNIPHRHKTNYRLYNSVTNLPSFLLKFLTMDGEPIYEFDLANSQLAILSNFFMNPESQLFNPLTELVEDDQINYLKKKINESKRQDKTQRFLNNCFEGKIYKACSTHLYDSTSKDDVDKIKMRFMTLLYGDPRYMRSSKLGASIHENYPEVFNIIFSLRQLLITAFSTTKDPKYMSKNFSSKNVYDLYKMGSNYFAIALQRIEADLFIDNLLPALYNSGIKHVLTKHDSILCKKSDRVKVQNILTDKLDELLGESQYNLRSNELT